MKKTRKSVTVWAKIILVSLACIVISSLPFLFISAKAFIDGSLDLFRRAEEIGDIRLAWGLVLAAVLAIDALACFFFVKTIRAVKAGRGSRQSIK
jgi:uncharacterized protein YqgC (DUF456 family)